MCQIFSWLYEILCLIYILDIKKLWSEPKQQTDNYLMTTSMGILINLDAFTMLKDRVSDEVYISI